MNKGILHGLLFATVISWAGLVFSEQPEAQDTAEEASLPAKTENASGDAPLMSGISWRLAKKVEMANTGKFVHMVLVEPKKQMDKTIYSNVITRICGKEEEFCRIRFWIEERFIPEKSIPTGAQLRGQKADFLLNRRAGIHRTQWSCTVDHDRSECMDW
ncbi:MAG: hypothetical protein RQ714_08000 [Nitrosomonas sp.]|nr:hypothetical protein [Nitrosomonas sp.]